MSRVTGDRRAEAGSAVQLNSCRSAAEGFSVGRFAGSVAAVAAGAIGVYWLMVWDAHFLFLAAFGAVCGAVAGSVGFGRRGVLPGAAVGFVLPLAYLPLWFVLDLPPNTGIDL
jgi:hypothetical protein